MKERVVHSPKNAKPDNSIDIKFKKSPQKFVMYDSPQPPSQIPVKAHESQNQPESSIDNIRKLSDEVSSLRKTMSSNFASKMSRPNTLYEFEVEDDKPNKLNDFLRQTTSYRSTKAYS